MTARTPIFECQECSHKFYTVKAAERAFMGDHGCPGCGGSDIDVYLPKLLPGQKQKTLIPMWV